nr:ABC transporter permease subunit [Romeria gracilis]
MAYVAVVVSSRLSGLNPHLEEAALDLGATPAQALVKVLLPQLAPAILAGCLLAFVLSMDDLLISSFTAVAATPPRQKIGRHKQQRLKKPDASYSEGYGDRGYCQ